MDQNQGLVWGHLNVNVSDLERSIAFYRVMGFEIYMPAIPYLGLSIDASAVLTAETAEALGLPPGTRGRACIMQLGGGYPKLDLTEFKHPVDPRPGTNGDLGLVRFCLGTQDLQSEFERLTGCGVRFLSEPQRAEGGLAQLATCMDPDGTFIELIQIYPEKWAELAAKEAEGG